MYRLALYFFLFPAIFFNKGMVKPEPGKVDNKLVADTCRTIVERVSRVKTLEGKVCDEKREGVWREWYPDGRLKDSAQYINGVRIYTGSAVIHAKGSMTIRGNPKVFYKDSTYECHVKVNTYHGIHDIKGDYEGVADTIYPPLFYFGVDLGARDSFNYYFKPKAIGKYTLKLSLTGDAATGGGNAPFYAREIEVVKR